MHHQLNYSAFITTHLSDLNEYMGDMLEKDITFDGTSLTITSIHSEMDILTKFHHFHAEKDIDILTYKMDMDMTEDEDENWITTVILTITKALN